LKSVSPKAERNVEIGTPRAFKATQSWALNILTSSDCPADKYRLRDASMEQKKHLYKKNFFANNFAIYRFRYLCVSFCSDITDNPALFNISFPALSCCYGPLVSFLCFVLIFFSVSISEDFSVIYVCPTSTFPALTTVWDYF
jgi:hypothetical protein